MSLNQTPSAERLHIGIFGKRNAGKSSIINALTGQNLSIVSEVKGTTTDPVLKAMELLPLGPVVLIDTPGLDDEGELGNLRVQKAYQMLNKTDLAILVVDGTVGMTQEDWDILGKIKEKQIPCLVVKNKADLLQEKTGDLKDVEDLKDAGDLEDAGNLKSAEDLKDAEALGVPMLWVSASKQENISEMKEQLTKLVPQGEHPRTIVGDLIQPLDLIVLVVPIDASAPKGRLILPQQQTIRDILDHGAVAVVAKDTELKQTLKTLGKKPALVITDSQAFEKVAQETPEDIPLTSFSILFARYKGNLEVVASGAKALDTLEDGDTVLIAEGCTHHRQCEDIGTVKLPRFIKKYTKKEINFEFTSGTEFPVDLKKYKMIIHCGGCTLNEREMKYRLKCAGDAGIPITNYGTAIAYMKGILERSLGVFTQFRT